MKRVCLNEKEHVVEGYECEYACDNLPYETRATQTSECCNCHLPIPSLSYSECVGKRHGNTLDVSNHHGSLPSGLDRYDEIGQVDLVVNVNDVRLVAVAQTDV